MINIIPNMNTLLRVAYPLSEEWDIPFNEEGKGLEKLIRLFNRNDKK